ncbi:MAG: NHLP bacteriocin export ABC transporter permease/ATPase subunit [Anaerolineae bacterium]|nr:NHLP bacteriocin export ABC transporter permease/ATPase subunit [Anaerolineae bacterium]
MKTQATLYDFAAELAPPRWMLREQGKLEELSGNHPILLTDPNSVWIIFSGRVDVFAVRLYDGKIAGTRRRLFRCDTGQGLFGIAIKGEGREIGLLASSVPGTSLLRLDRDQLMSQAQDPVRGPDIVNILEAWVYELCVSTGKLLSPKAFRTVQADQELDLDTGQVAFPTRGIAWTQHLSGESQFLDCSLPVGPGDGLIPVSHYTWLTALMPTRLRTIDTQTFVAQDPAWAGLDRFHALMTQCFSATTETYDRAESGRLKARAHADQTVVQSAIARLANVLTRVPIKAPDTDEGQDALFAACHRVGDALGVEVKTPHPANQTEHTRDRTSIRLKAIAQASHLRIRQVHLENGWWRKDSGPLLAFVQEEMIQHPVALVPASPTSYNLYDPAQGSLARVSARTAAQIAPRAFVFYRPFPARALTALDLWRFSLKGTRRDLHTVLWMVLASSMLALLIPLGTSWVFNNAIPLSNAGLLLQIFGALIAGALGGAVFQFAQSIAILRIQTQMSASIQAATWDRLLSLPVPFFRQYTAGDLGSRALGIDTIRRTLASTTITSLLSGVSSAFSLGLLFYYAPHIAWIAVALVALTLIASTLFGYTQINHQRTSARLKGDLSGIVLQLISGVAKLRVAGAEGRALGFWTQRFARQKQLDYQARLAETGLTVFNAIYPLLNQIILLGLIVFARKEGQPMLSAGQFVAFYAAFGQLLAAGLQISTALLEVWNLIPTYERARPILQTLPEVDEARADPGELSGEIEVEHVHFRYKPESPPVLHDVSLHVDPGEFVALVGTSGSGKSTLFRILLGFETPESGAVLYNGQELANLDIQAVRRQIGVVLQNGKLMSGTILSNIIGAAQLSVDDAWEAARMVSLDKDIEQMPMGMYTVIGQGGSTLSGGQRQRILIARAVVRKPRILFFDEATSALDNTAQTVVSQSLERLQATRIVIAHRLSTIIKADRIFVLDKGQIVQSGTFDELVERTGVFADLAKRQLA